MAKVLKDQIAQVSKKMQKGPDQTRDANVASKKAKLMGTIHTRGVGLLRMRCGKPAAREKERQRIKALGRKGRAAAKKKARIREEAMKIARKELEREGQSLARREEARQKRAKVAAKTGAAKKTDTDGAAMAKPTVVNFANPDPGRDPCNMLLQSIEEMVNRQVFQTDVLCVRARAVEAMIKKLESKATSTASTQARRLKQQVAAARQALRDARAFAKRSLAGDAKTASVTVTEESSVACESASGKPEEVPEDVAHLESVTDELADEDLAKVVRDASIAARSQIAQKAANIAVKDCKAF